jgi:hypothetical protein
MERLRAEVIRLEGSVDPPHLPLELWPKRGLPLTVLEDNHAELLDTLVMMRRAAAMGDISAVQDHVMLALAHFHIELDEHSPAYIKLSTACKVADRLAREAWNYRMLGYILIIRATSWQRVPK